MKFYFIFLDFIFPILYATLKLSDHSFIPLTILSQIKVCVANMGKKGSGGWFSSVKKVFKSSKESSDKNKSTKSINKF
ncbi:hypothetical protein RDABS01_013307 [Bienertia sinuspersici]